MPQHSTPDGLCYEVHGPDDAPAVVFLNGTGQTTLYWQNAARRLRRRWRVVLYDARGQGRSPLNGRRLDLQGHVATCWAFCLNWPLDIPANPVLIKKFFKITPCGPLAAAAPCSGMGPGLDTHKEASCSGTKPFSSSIPT